MVVDDQTGGYIARTRFGESTKFFRMEQAMRWVENYVQHLEETQSDPCADEPVSVESAS